MLTSARRPLVRAASSKLAPSSTSSIAVQTRLASDNRDKQGFQNADARRKGKEKPKRDKVPGAYLPLPTAQRSKIVPLIESGLSAVPALGKGAISPKLAGQITQLPELGGNTLKTLGLPRNILFDFRLLSAPAAVTRKATVDLAQRLDSARESSSSNERTILTGPAGCGKSYLLLQAVIHCLVNDWIVLYVPRAHKLVDSSTSYVYDSRTQTYLQPSFSNQLLQRVMTVNKKALDSLLLSQTVSFDKRPPVPAGTPLSQLVNVATSETHLAPFILSILFEELGKQESYPVLLAIDEVQALYSKTDYRSQQFERIKSYHLSVPRLVMEYLGGKKAFNRGAVIGALSLGLTQYPPPAELAKTLELDKDRPISPYTKLLPGMLEYTTGIKSFPVPEKLEFGEAAAIFEMWAKDGALHSQPNDELFLTKYSEASGNARDFVHNGLLATQMS